MCYNRQHQRQQPTPGNAARTMPNAMFALWRCSQSYQCLQEMQDKQYECIRDCRTLTGDQLGIVHQYDAHRGIASARSGSACSLVHPHAYAFGCTFSPPLTSEKGASHRGKQGGGRRSGKRPPPKHGAHIAGPVHHSCRALRQADRLLDC